MKCTSGGGRGRPRSRPTSWCRTSPSHGAPSTTAGRVYCPSPPWLEALRLVTQHGHSTEHRVWKAGRKVEGKGGGGRRRMGQQGKMKRKRGLNRQGGGEKQHKMPVIEHSGTILQHLLISIRADIHKQYLASLTKGCFQINTLRRDPRWCPLCPDAFEEKLAKIKHGSLFCQLWFLFSRATVSFIFLPQTTTDNLWINQQICSCVSRLSVSLNTVTHEIL